MTGRVQLVRKNPYIAPSRTASPLFFFCGKLLDSGTVDYMDINDVYEKYEKLRAALPDVWLMSVSRYMAKFGSDTVETEVSVGGEPLHVYMTKVVGLVLRTTETFAEFVCTEPSGNSWTVSAYSRSSDVVSDLRSARRYVEDMARNMFRCTRRELEAAGASFELQAVVSGLFIRHPRRTPVLGHV